MIVALAAWLYIVQALLGLASLFPGPFGFGGGSSAFATLIVSGIFGAMGYGLLKRETWGRWLALGVSLLSWTFGSLFLVCLLGALVFSGKGGSFVGMMFSGAMVIVGVIALITLLIMVVSVVISFKLFFYLCSQDGCEEFGVPYGSAGTVAASVGAWLAIMLGQVFMTSGGGGGLALMLAQQAMSRDRHEDSRVNTEQMRVEAERREYQRAADERRRQAEQDAQRRATREAENRRALESAAVAPEPQVVDSGDSKPVEEAPTPVMDRPEEEEKTTGKQILKCRDSSGSVMFTQGYCPPGTKRVDMPKND